MTERLYYDNAYLTEFTAHVLEVRQEEGRTLVRLDRSAFYPTSGGQPYDTGRLGDANVLDVFVDDAGEVWHAVDAAPALESEIKGKIDWPRRFDHMQQHGGEHMLAGCVHRLFGGHTIGLHLGAEVSTIDVDLPGGATHLTEAQIQEAEDTVNRQIQSCAPVKCWFPDEEELKALPLRKAPTVTEHVRIVAFGDFEMVACGGTHPRCSGEIGCIKIVDARPSKGKVRLSFVCGMRAIKEFQTTWRAANTAAAALSTTVQALPEAIEHLKEKEQASKRLLNAANRQIALGGVPALMENARTLGDVHVVAATLPEMAPDALREVANAIIANPATIALLASPRENGGVLLLFARSADCEVNMGALMRKSTGGKGGGRPDFAQGGAADTQAIENALLELAAE